MIKVYFKDGGFWDSIGCSCCEPIYIDYIEFAYIEGVKCPADYESYDYEMYNGSKGSEWDCLVSVFWDLVADKEQYEDFYDMCESFYDIEESKIKLMLLSKGIEVIFLEED